MLCYNGQTYCINPDCTCHPSRRMTKAVEDAAHAWWERSHPGHGNEAPIAVADMCQGKPQQLAAEAAGTNKE